MPGEIIFLLWYGVGLFITFWLLNILKKQIARNAGVTPDPLGAGTVILAFILAFLGPLNLMACIFLDGSGD